MQTIDSPLSFITADGGHVPLPARRCRSAKLLWLNPRARQIDPLGVEAAGSLEGYGQRLLDRCGFLVGRDGDADGEYIVDRYGGAGIGHNGGSGRTGYIHGYNVKGIGRTPLVSASTPESHASGGAYLEECVRETIFSEIAALGLPHSAVPTLAIIDTGEIQDWRTTWVPIMERRTLLVRPAFLRPAHFERASGFISNNRREGALDEARVQRMFERLLAQSTPQVTIQVFDTLWLRWSEQLAWGFVNRLPHVSNTTSNIALDGRLVDFGAMTAVPSWARTASSFHHHGFIEQMGSVMSCAKALGYFVGRYVCSSYTKGERLAHTQALIRSAYECAMVREFLRLLGVGTLYDRYYARDMCALARLRAMVLRLAHHFHRENLDMLEATPAPRLPFDLAAFWQVRPPEHLRELRRELAGTLGEMPVDSATRIAADAQHAKLYFPEMKRAIYDGLDFSATGGPAPSRAAVTALIEDYLLAGTLPDGASNCSSERAPALASE